MFDINDVISRNIIKLLSDKGKKQIDLANYLGVSKQVMSKMLSGARIFNAGELYSIAEYLDVDMKSLMIIPECFTETNAIKVFMGNVNTKEAKEGLGMLDEIADKILFYKNAREKMKRMAETWEV